MILDFGMIWKWTVRKNYWNYLKKSVDEAIKDLLMFNCAKAESQKSENIVTKK